MRSLGRRVCLPRRVSLGARAARRIPGSARSPFARSRSRKRSRSCIGAQASVWACRRARRGHDGTLTALPDSAAGAAGGGGACSHGAARLDRFVDQTASGPGTCHRAVAGAVLVGGVSCGRRGRSRSGCAPAPAACAPARPASFATSLIHRLAYCGMASAASDGDLRHLGRGASDAHALGFERLRLRGGGAGGARDDRAGVAHLLAGRRGEARRCRRRRAWSRARRCTRPPPPRPSRRSRRRARSARSARRPRTARGCRRTSEPGTGSPPMPTIELQPKPAWAISLPIW